MIYKNKSTVSLEGEIWVDVLYYDGSYSVSNLGRVKSEQRIVNNGTSSGRIVNERMLSQAKNNQDNRLAVNLSINNKPNTHDVSVLVWESFNGEKPEGKVVTHKNKDQRDNRLCNLILTTWSESHSINFRLGLLPHLEKIHASMVGSKWNEEHGVYVDGILTEILCNHCFQHKAITMFEATRNCCKECRLLRAGIVEVGKMTRIKTLKEVGLKRCTSCTDIKPLSSFAKDASKCIPCRKARTKELKLLKR